MAHEAESSTDSNRIQISGLFFVFVNNLKKS